MKLKLAPSLLLMVLHCDPAAAFAPPSRATKSIQTSLFNYNNYNYDDDQYNNQGYYNEAQCNNQGYYEEENYHNDNYHPIYNEPNVDFSRRESTGAFFRGLTAAGAMGAAGAMMRSQNAWAAEFSDGGFTSSAATVQTAPPPVQQPQVTPGKPVRSAKAAMMPQFTKLRSNPVNSSTVYRNSLAEMDSGVLAAGAVATAGFFGWASTQQQDSWDSEAPKPVAAAPVAATPAASVAPMTNATPAAEKPKAEEKAWYKPPTPYGLVNKDKNPFADKPAATIPSAVAGAPPAFGTAPYGLAQGRNYWDGKVLQTATSLPKPPAPPAKPVPPAPPKEFTGDKWYKPPTPYGLVNKDKNPFLKDIQQFCEPGKVSEPCTESIKGYLSDLSESDQSASGEAAKTIVGYLDSLGGSGDAKPSLGSYVDALGGSTEVVKQALSTGSTPPPASAAAVKEYLDALNIGRKPVATGMVMTPPPPKPQPVSANLESYAVYDSRMTSIENRVDRLEERVGQLPDQIFDRMESWRMQQQNRWSGEFSRLEGMIGNSSGNDVYVSPAPPSTPPPQVLVASAQKSIRRGMGGYLDNL
jgi:hypothetical protein